MTAKRKRRKRRHDGHIVRRRRGVVFTALRLGFEATVEPRLNGSKHRVIPATSEAIARLASGRACQSLVGHWLNGRRRAPAWFVAVLVGELEKQIEHRRAILEQLSRYETGDRRRSPEARARARLLRMRQLGRLRENNEPASAPDANAVPKNEPHKSP